MASTFRELLHDIVRLQGKGTLQDDGEALLTGFVAFFAQQPAVKVRSRTLLSSHVDSTCSCMQCIVATHYNMHTALQSTTVESEQGSSKLSDLVQVAHMGSVDESDTANVEVDQSAELEHPFQLQPGWTSGAKALQCARKVRLYTDLAQVNRMKQRASLQNGVKERVVQRAQSILDFLRATRSESADAGHAAGKKQRLAQALRRVQESTTQGLQHE